MGGIYKGFGLSRAQVGEYENGNIYSGHGLGREIIGSYDKDCIYDESNSLVGKYYDGQIFSGSGFGASQIGEYSNGTIYSNWGLSKSQVGEYTGGPAGAAAYLLLNFSSVASANSSSDTISSNQQDFEISNLAIILVLIALVFIVFIIKSFIDLMKILIPVVNIFLWKYDLYLAGIADIILVIMLKYKKIININYYTLPSVVCYTPILFLDFLIIKVIINNTIFDSTYTIILTEIAVYLLSSFIPALLIHWFQRIKTPRIICYYSNHIIQPFLLIEVALYSISSIGFWDSSAFILFLLILYLGFLYVSDIILP